MPSPGLSLRTALEYTAIAIALLAFFGGSKIQSLLDSGEKRAPIENALVSQDKIESLVYPASDLQCSNHPLDIHIFSRAPLIIYIPNFVSDEEAKHLVDISAPHWTPSTIFNGGREAHDPTIRKSEKARIPRDHSVQCIEQRALSFQGWPSDTFIERLWTQRYTRSGHYAHHYDYSSASAHARRVSTFMVYLAANCSGGGTNFPLLERPDDQRWCEFVECGDLGEGVQGVTFLPKAGAAVFWENFDAEGRGWKEGLHAGMPVTEGVKVGLNIWSWYQKGHKPSVD